MTEAVTVDGTTVGIRQTDSGIFLVDPAQQKGKQHVQLVHDFPGAVTNVIGPEDDDCARIASEIADLQARIERNEDVPAWAFVEPIFGRRDYLTRAGIASVRHVCVAFTQDLDVIAEQLYMREKMEAAAREQARDAVAERRRADLGIQVPGKVVPMNRAERRRGR